jgi:hypothetical protein
VYKDQHGDCNVPSAHTDGGSPHDTFERLKAYREEYGKCHVPRPYNDGGSPHLGMWVNRQRALYHKGLLSPDRIDQLESIGFMWKLSLKDDEKWERVFQRLLVYKDQHGDCNVPSAHTDGESPHLGIWVSQQRGKYMLFTKTCGKVGYISQKRIDKLDSIGFVWEVVRQDEYDAAWMAQFEDYKAFQQKYNTTKAKILAKGSDDPITKSGRWLINQIVGYNRFMANKTSAITEEKIKLLNSTGFTWSLKSENHYEKWVHMYFKLYIYYHYQHNSTSVSEADGHNSMFVKWTRQQKEDYKNGTLTKLQIDLLNELDFDWNLDPPPTWDDMYEELVQYRINHGSTLINGYINRELRRWTKQQRKDYLKGRLDVDKIKKLEMLVFDWNPKDSAFNAMVDRLANFKKKYNSTVVPKVFDEDPPLGSFVFRQRNIYGKNLSNVDNENIDNDLLWSIAYDLESTVIPADTHFARMKRLTDLEFVWDVLESQWMEMYQRLVAYNEVHNTTLSVERNPQDQDLRNWATHQRIYQAHRKLSARRIALLNDIDFVWDPLDTNWNEMFDRLVEFKIKNNGSTMVREGYKEDPELARWVATQRRVKKQNGLSPERIDRLDSIGFVWAVR